MVRKSKIYSCSGLWTQEQWYQIFTCNKCVFTFVLSHVMSHSTFYFLSSPIPIPNPSPKSKSQIQVPNTRPKFKVQRKGTGTGAETIILQATHPPTNNFSHLKCQSSDGKRPSITFLDLPWPSLTFYDVLWRSMTFYDLLWPSMTFYDLLSPSNTSMTFYD